MKDTIRMSSTRLTLNGNPIETSPEAVAAAIKVKLGLPTK